jgi:hypothetical protein
MNHCENVDIKSSTKLAPSACNIHHVYRIELDNGVQHLARTFGQTPKGRAADAICLRLEDGEGVAELAVVGGREEGDELAVGDVLVSVLHHLVRPAQDVQLLRAEEVRRDVGVEGVGHAAFLAGPKQVDGDPVLDLQLDLGHLGGAVAHVSDEASRRKVA